MPTVIMPKMGDGMEEGTLLRWLKNVGEEVDAGEPIAEIETDKVSLEIEAAEGGILTETMVGEGQTVPIGTPIATIGEADVVCPSRLPLQSWRLRCRSLRPRSFPPRRSLPRSPRLNRLQLRPAPTAPARFMKRQPHRFEPTASVSALPH